MVMRRTFSFLSMIVLLVGAGGLVFAGGQGEAEAEGETVELSFWNMPFVTQEVSPAYVERWETGVEEALPNITVDDFYGPGDYDEQRQNFIVQGDSGTPDIIEGLAEDVPVYVQRESIEPLDDYFEAWEDSDQFAESTLEAASVGGTLYGIPYNTNGRALAYREDVLDDLGLDVPETWTELIEAARTITEETDMYGLFLCTDVSGPRGPQEFLSWYYQVSEKDNMFSVSGDTGEDVAYEASVDDLTIVLELYDAAFTGDNPAVDRNERGNGWESEDPGFVEGRWAMAPMGPWLWGRRQDSDTARDVLENKTALSSLPVYEDGATATYLEVKSIMMNTASEHKEEAWELMKYITSEEMMARWLVDTGGIPPRTDSLESEIFTESEIGWWLEGFAEQVPNAVGPAPINWGPVNEANMRAVSQVIYDEMSPEEAAEWLHNEVSGLNDAGEL